MNNEDKRTELIKDLAASLLVTHAEEIDARKLDFLRRHGILSDWRPLEPQNEQARAYLAKLKKAPQEEPAPERFTEAELKKKVAFYANDVARKRGFAWVWDQTTQTLCRELLYYFANDPRCIWPLDKGLCFLGATGVGKTILLRVFQNFIVNILPNNPKRFRFTTCRGVYDDFARGQYAAIEKYTLGNWCFDDLGQEEQEYQHFGNRISVMEQVLFYRDKERERGYMNTLITSNLNTEEIEARYGTRVFDRMKAMVTFFQIPGESRRG